MKKSLSHRLVRVTGVVLLAACGGDHSSSTGLQSTPCATASVVTLDPLRGVTLPADSANCLEMAPGSGSYVIVPQFAIANPDSSLVPFEIGALSAASADVARDVLPLIIPASAPTRARSGPHGPFATAFDHQRRLEARTAAATLARSPAARAAIASARIASDATPPALGSTRIFQVCSTATCSATKPDTAILKVVGTNILLYQSQDAVVPPSGFTDPELSAYGNIFDQTLYPIDSSAFGAPTDIDANGRVMILITPKVNSLVSSATCQTEGYVAGFFWGPDLVPAFPGSNQGELYYSIAPDPAGAVSCAHTKGEVADVSGGVFLHETLHMINFGSKILAHGLFDTEVEFLDEGMAKIAEELGSKHYEALYPPPTGRSNPAQLFPDSAEGFIGGDLYDSYAYLLAPRASTATTIVFGGSDLPMAGGEWLLLRWLGDQHGEGIYHQIVQSALTGVPNIEAQAGEPFNSLFAKAGLTLYTDSIPGLARDQVPAAYHLTSRNVRQLNAATYRAFGGPTAQFPRAFALQAQPLSANATVQITMMKGTMGYFIFATPSSGSPMRLHFTRAGGASFATTLGAQVTVFRCPVGVTCQ